MREPVHLGVAHPGLARARGERAQLQVEQVRAPDRAERVGGREQRHRVLADPAEPVEVALVARPLLGRAGARLLAAVRDALGAAGVVGADVEEAVELAERGREVRVRLGQVLGRAAAGSPGTAARRARTAAPGSSGSAPPPSRTAARPGWRRRASGTAAAAPRSVGPICCASVSTLPSVEAVWLSVPGSFDDERRDVLVLVGEGAERRVRAAHEPGDVLVALAAARSSGARSGSRAGACCWRRSATASARRARGRGAAARGA